MRVFEGDGLYEALSKCLYLENNERRLVDAGDNAGRFRVDCQRALSDLSLNA